MMIAVIEFDTVGANKKIVENLGDAKLVSPYEDIDLASFDGIVLSGSGNPDASYCPSDYSETLISELTTIRVPILGVCFGMQFLAAYYGGIIGLGQGEFGWTVAVLDTQTDLLTGYHRREMVHMDHVCDVSSLPVPHNDYRVIASTHQTDIAGFKHRFLPVYGVMWHPEKMTKRGSILFRNFKRICQVEHPLP